MKLNILYVQAAWDNCKDLVGVYTDAGLETAKDILIRNRYPSIFENFDIETVVVDEMPYDREKEDQKKADAWLENPVLEN